MSRIAVLLGWIVLTVGFTTAARAEGALVINPAAGCTVGVLNGGEIVWTSSDDARIVITQSSNGNAKYVCKITDVPNDTGSALHYDYQWILDNLGVDFPCVYVEGSFVGISRDWRQIVSASGEAKLVCTFKD